MISIQKLKPLNTQRRLFDREMLSAKDTQEKLDLIHSEINKCTQIVNNRNSDTYIKKYYQDWLRVLTDSLASVA